MALHRPLCLLPLLLFPFPHWRSELLWAAFTFSLSPDHENNRPFWFLGQTSDQETDRYILQHKMINCTAKALGLYNKGCTRAVNMRPGCERILYTRKGVVFLYNGRCIAISISVHQRWQDGTPRVGFPAFPPTLPGLAPALPFACSCHSAAFRTFFFLWLSLQLTFIDCQVIQFQDVSGNRSVMKGVPLFLIQMQFLLWARFLLDGRSVDRRELLPAGRCGFILSPSRTGRTSWSCWEGVSSWAS